VITSFRMYEAVPAAAAAWRALFGRVFGDLGLDIRIVEHKFPQPIDALWAEPELCCAFMCGWPFARSTSGMQAIAAPVPSPSRYEGLPRYCSDFVARAESGFGRLEDAFGYRFGWMAENSHSGFNAPRAHLARFVQPGRTALFAQSVGPLGNPARTLEALRARSVDVVAVDGFYLDLVRRHDPARLEGLAVVDSTPWMPIPLLVAAPSIEPAVVGRLQEHLLRVHGRPGYGALLASVLLSRFVAPDVAAYQATERLRESAERAGYAAIR
jgi:ABC-type phosphate/phosphonate transport system substrate-binding protein